MYLMQENEVKMSRSAEQEKVLELYRAARVEDHQTASDVVESETPSSLDWNTFSFEDMLRALLAE